MELAQYSFNYVICDSSLLVQPLLDGSNLRLHSPALDRNVRCFSQNPLTLRALESYLPTLILDTSYSGFLRLKNKYSIKTIFITRRHQQFLTTVGFLFELTDLQQIKHTTMNLFYCSTEGLS